MIHSPTSRASPRRNAIFKRSLSLPSRIAKTGFYPKCVCMCAASLTSLIFSLFSIMSSRNWPVASLSNTETHVVVFHPSNAGRDPTSSSWLTTWWRAKWARKLATWGCSTPSRSTGSASRLCIRCGCRGCWFCYYPGDCRWRTGSASSSPPSPSPTDLCYRSAPRPRWSAAWPTFFPGCRHCSLSDAVRPRCSCSPAPSVSPEGSGPSDGSPADGSDDRDSGWSWDSAGYPTPGSPIFADRSARCCCWLASGNTRRRWNRRRPSRLSRCRSRCTNPVHPPRRSPRSRRSRSLTRCCSRCSPSGWTSFPGCRSASSRWTPPRFETPIRREVSTGPPWSPAIQTSRILSFLSVRFVSR